MILYLSSVHGVPQCHHVKQQTFPPCSRAFLLSISQSIVGFHQPKDTAMAKENAHGNRTKFIFKSNNLKQLFQSFARQLFSRYSYTVLAVTILTLAITRVSTILACVLVATLWSDERDNFSFA